MNVLGLFLKSKGEAFDTFKRFKALVENENGYKIKFSRIDRGGEFFQEVFKIVVI